MRQRHTGATERKQGDTHMSQTRDWLEGREATELLSRKSGRQIHEGVVRDRAAKGKVRKKLKPGYVKVNLYYRPDLERLCPIRPLRRSEA